MDINGIFENRRFKRLVLITAAFTVLYLLINLFVIGGDALVISLNDKLAIPLALVTSLSAFSQWKQEKTDHRGRVLWGGLFAGWACWTVAEVLWSVFEMLSEEAPFPSLADLFWLIGYVPMGIALLYRIREMPIKSSSAQKTVIWVGSLAIIFITIYYIILPLVQDYDPSALLASIISIIYPLTDVFLLVVALQLLFVYQKGKEGFCWNLLSIGFILMTIADLVFAYTVSFDLYYPGDKVNLISSLGMSVPYNLAYVLWSLGIYSLHLYRSKRDYFAVIEDQTPIVARTHILIFTQKDGVIVEVSQNFRQVFETKNVIGARLDQALNLSNQEIQTWLDKTRADKKIADQPIHLVDRFGALREASISGIADIDINGVFLGYNLMLQIPGQTYREDDAALNQYERSMVKNLQNMSGSGKESEIKQFLLNYYLAYVKRLSNLVFHTGGELAVSSLFEMLSQTARARRWPIAITPQTLINAGDCSLELLREALPVMIEQTRIFSTNFLGPTTVEAAIRQVAALFSDAVRENVTYHMKTDY